MTSQLYSSSVQGWKFGNVAFLPAVLLKSMQKEGSQFQLLINWNLAIFDFYLNVSGALYRVAVCQLMYLFSLNEYIHSLRCLHSTVNIAQNYSNQMKNSRVKLLF